jgi:TP901 family phage tail tape measure protein
MAEDITLSLGLDLSPLAAALGNTEAQLSLFGETGVAAVKKIEQAAPPAAAAIATVGTEAAKTGQTTVQTGEQARDAFGKFITAAQAAGQATKKAGEEGKAGLDEIKAATDTAKASMSGMSDVAKGLGATIAALGLGLAFHELSGGLMECVTTFGTFQATLNATRAITGASAEDMKALQAEAIKMGQITQYSANEAAQGMARMARDGFDAQQIIAALPAVLSLAAASATSVDSAARIGAGSLRSFGLEAAQMGLVADVMAKATTSSGMSLENMGEAIKVMGPIAHATGQSFTDMSTELALLGKQMLVGGVAGTGLQGIIQRLVAPPKEAAKALADLKISVKDTAGDMLPLNDIIDQLRDKTAKMTTTDKEAELAKISGRYALKDLLTLVDAAPDAYAKMNANLSEVSASARIAQTMMEGVTGAFKLASSSGETLEKVLGEQLAPAAILVANTIQHTEDMLSSMSPTALAIAAAIGVAGTAFTGLGVFVAGVSAVIGTFNAVAVGSAAVVASALATEARAAIATAATTAAAADAAAVEVAAADALIKEIAASGMIWQTGEQVAMAARTEAMVAFNTATIVAGDAAIAASAASTAAGEAAAGAVGASAWIALLGPIGPLLAGLAAVAVALGVGTGAMALMGDKAALTSAKIYDQKEKLNDLADEYETLKNKTSPSADEQKRMAEILAILVKISPDLVSGFDNQGNAIDINTAAVDRLSTAYDTLIAKQHAAAQVSLASAHVTAGAAQQEYDKVNHKLQAQQGNLTALKMPAPSGFNFKTQADPAAVAAQEAEIAATKSEVAAAAKVWQDAVVVRQAAETVADATDPDVQQFGGGVSPPVHTRGAAVTTAPARTRAKKDPGDGSKAGDINAQQSDEKALTEAIAKVDEAAAARSIALQLQTNDQKHRDLAAALANDGMLLTDHNDQLAALDKERINIVAAGEMEKLRAKRTALEAEAEQEAAALNADVINKDQAQAFTEARKLAVTQQGLRQNAILFQQAADKLSADRKAVDDNTASANAKAGDDYLVQQAKVADVAATLQHQTSDIEAKGRLDGMGYYERWAASAENAYAEATAAAVKNHADQEAIFAASIVADDDPKMIAARAANDARMAASLALAKSNNKVTTDAIQADWTQAMLSAMGSVADLASSPSWGNLASTVSRLFDSKIVQSWAKEVDEATKTATGDAGQLAGILSGASGYIGLAAGVVGAFQQIVTALDTESPIATTLRAVDAQILTIKQDAGSGILTGLAADTATVTALKQGLADLIKQRDDAVRQAVTPTWWDKPKDGVSTTDLATGAAAPYVKPIADQSQAIQLAQVTQTTKALNDSIDNITKNVNGLDPAAMLASKSATYKTAINDLISQLGTSSSDVVGKAIGDAIMGITAGKTTDSFFGQESIKTVEDTLTASLEGTKERVRQLLMSPADALVANSSAYKKALDDLATYLVSTGDAGVRASAQSAIGTLLDESNANAAPVKSSSDLTALQDAANTAATNFTNAQHTIDANNKTLNQGGTDKNGNLISLRQQGADQVDAARNAAQEKITTLSLQQLQAEKDITQIETDRAAAVLAVEGQGIAIRALTEFQTKTDAIAKINAKAATDTQTKTDVINKTKTDILDTTTALHEQENTINNTLNRQVDALTLQNTQALAIQANAEKTLGIYGNQLAIATAIANIQSAATASAASDVSWNSGGSGAANGGTAGGPGDYGPAFSGNGGSSGGSSGGAVANTNTDTSQGGGGKIAYVNGAWGPAYADGAEMGPHPADGPAYLHKNEVVVNAGQQANLFAKLATTAPTSPPAHDFTAYLNRPPSMPSSADIMAVHRASTGGGGQAGGMTINGGVTITAPPGTSQQQAAAIWRDLKALGGADVRRLGGLRT